MSIVPPEGPAWMMRYLKRSHHLPGLVQDRHFVPRWTVRREEKIAILRPLLEMPFEYDVAGRERRWISHSLESSSFAAPGGLRPGDPFAEPIHIDGVILSVCAPGATRHPDWLAIGKIGTDEGHKFSIHVYLCRPHPSP